VLHHSALLSTFEWRKVKIFLLLLRFRSTMRESQFIHNLAISSHTADVIPIEHESSPPPFPAEVRGRLSMLVVMRQNFRVRSKARPGPVDPCAIILSGLASRAFGAKKGRQA